MSASASSKNNRRGPLKPRKRTTRKPAGTAAKANPFQDGKQNDFPLGLRTLIVGSTGSGKSTLARYMIERSNHRRVLIMDPTKDMEKSFGLGAITTLRSVAQYFGSRRPPRIKVFRADAYSYGAQADAIANMAMQAQQPFEDGAMSARLLLVFDEASQAMPSRRELSRDMHSLISRGRHMGIDILAITQRPKNVNAEMRSAAAHKYLFPVHDATDRDALQESIGKAGVARLDDLPEFHCLRRIGGSDLVTLNAPNPAEK